MRTDETKASVNVWTTQRKSEEERRRAAQNSMMRAKCTRSVDRGWAILCFSLLFFSCIIGDDSLCCATNLVPFTKSLLFLNSYLLFEIWNLSSFFCFFFVWLFHVLLLERLSADTGRESAPVFWLSSLIPLALSLFFFELSLLRVSLPVWSMSRLMSFLPSARYLWYDGVLLPSGAL